jgi:hypothetical protein
MNDENVKAVIEGLNGVARDMEHWKFREDVDRVAVEDMRRLVLEGVKLLYTFDNAIRAMMGEYGDSCSVDGCGSE